MSRTLKTYSTGNLTAQFQISIKKWLVKSKDKEYYLKNVFELVEAFPEFLKEDRIKEMIKLREKLRSGESNKYEKKTKMKSKAPQLEKKIACYYCSGSGKMDSGLICDNCKGKGEVIVTASLY